MSGPLDNQIERRLAELDRQRAAMAEAEQELASAHTETTSRNRVVTVVVDSRGELVDIKFRTEAYRSMAGAELSRLLVDTIRTARVEARTRAARVFEAVLPGMPLVDLMNGRVDIDELARGVAELAEDPRAGSEGTEERSGT